MDNLHTALKEQTQEAHTKLNKLTILASIVSDSITEHQYENLISAYYSIYENIENAIHEYVNTHPTVYSIVYKKEWLAEDLRQSPKQIESFFKINSFEELLGVMYVIEGSTLGNQFLIKKLEPRLKDSYSLRFFHSYGESTRQRWEDFLYFLNTSTNLNQTQVITAANNTFSYFYNVLESL